MRDCATCGFSCVNLPLRREDNAKTRQQTDTTGYEGRYSLADGLADLIGLMNALGQDTHLALSVLDTCKPSPPTEGLQRKCWSTWPSSAICSVCQNIHGWGQICHQPRAPLRCLTSDIWTPSTLKMCSENSTCSDSCVPSRCVWTLFAICRLVELADLHACWPICVIAKGIPRGCQGLFTPVSLGYPWDTHYQFSIKTLLSDKRLIRA